MTRGKMALSRHRMVLVLCLLSLDRCAGLMNIGRIQKKVAVRGGGGTPFSILKPTTAASLYDGIFGGLVAAAVVAKTSSRVENTKEAADSKELKRVFLPTFWLLRAADWMQGPYFYEVYASKVSDSLGLVSKLFLAGFGSTAIFGPYVGRVADEKGRKKATLCFTVLYAMAALSTKSTMLSILFAGRVLSGIGTSLLFSAPEAWLVGEARRVNATDAALGSTLGAAYGGDALVAIAAGQLASLAAAARGPVGPFEFSVLFLFFGALTAATRWTENTADSNASPTDTKREVSISDAFKLMLNDSRILLVGAMQALFEGAMYVFVLQWPPAITKAVRGVFGAQAATPFGKIFSCFMVSCLLGSTAFSWLQRKKISVEHTALATTSAAALSMAAATAAISTSGTLALAALTSAFFAFELCVGLYFPSIGTLRAKYVPDSHRSVIMNIFGIPLNALVVSVFLSIKTLGVQGALAVASTALLFASTAAATLLAHNKKNLVHP